MSKKKRVFLGGWGTCNGSDWRQRLIPMLTIDFFDPVVEYWTEECKQRELYERSICNYCLYVITPRMIGTYSIAEAVDDSNKRPKKTIFCVLQEDQTPDKMLFLTAIYKNFTKAQINSLNEVGKLIETNGGKYFTSLREVAEYLNGGV